SMAIHTPPLDDDALVLKGAGHYEGGCRPCHGAPGSPRPAIPMQMTPKPPDLASRAAAWKPRELFHIVKHGIKFTGMPAWPAARRDDEVWAVVAFLVRMPGLEPDAYRRLVRGEAAVVPAVAQLASPEAQQEIPPAVTRTCGRCHGAEGNGRGEGAFPRLAGQRPQYLLAALDAYARGDRFSGIMGPIAAALAPAERDEVAAYYATLAPQPGGHAADQAAAERGAALARDGIPGQRVPSCEDCHGFSTHPRNPSYPVLHGQHADYLELQLRLFAEGRRGGSPYARLMHSFAARLTPPQIRDLAEHYAAGPEGSPTARSGHGVTSASSP
ncbi:MAG TPA: c-type cytochrome, partial [Methylomirabilota bacterium]